ncbi:MAG: nucleotidyl transferase AbiEii/AbiGii toxin family protein [Ignavibacteriales bacterium]|nr:nucleotidyl transferase AbiEii/AbiGii toxin family protein [Ignavibacterium sp.]MCZ2268087.1 nucleotidyl transferase AbiEii/AbiGii toxin family protein [Ignavibacteriales bacterium]
MILHSADTKTFNDTIRAASEHLKINQIFVEKDYWITLVLNRLSKTKYLNETVFKGGTSLSKGFGLINRFSEDVDIAIIKATDKSGNVIKNIIRTVEKEITKELSELNLEGVTSKGSRFRKSVFEFTSIDKQYKNNRLIVEINSFANPFPYQQCTIKSFIYDFLKATNNDKYIEEYSLHPFTINVLKKEQTLLEKLVSLIRFSFDKNFVQSISAKIRHFYDLYYLMNDSECIEFTKSADFKKRFHEILEHDKELFDEPENWQSKQLSESPLINDFANIWQKLKEIYKTELSALAFSKIPGEEKVSKSFEELLKIIK